MADLPHIRPPLNEAPVGPNGQFSQTWLRYFQQLADQFVPINASLVALTAASTAHAARLTDLEARVTNIEARLAAVGVP
jgi:hypothetical protein